MKINSDCYEITEEDFCDDTFNTIIVDKTNCIIIHANNWNKDVDFPKTGIGYTCLNMKYMKQLFLKI